MIFNEKEALKHLELLGYRKGDRVYLRFFFPSDDPRKQGDKGRKLTATFPNLPWREIERYQVDGRGVYFVVNGGGHLDKEVTQCKAIFYEHDNLQKDLQAALWRSLNLPEPTLQVDTGGKSIHSYWVFDAPVDPDIWRPLQADLLVFADGDRSIKNPSRVMRLAGCNHLDPTRDPVAIPSKLISQSGQRYSFEQLRLLIPEQSQPKQSWAEFERSFQLQIVDMVPLEVCLSKRSRALIDQGAPQGQRNSSGAALARDLLGTAGHLQAIGQQFDGDPVALFLQFGDSCSPPISESERASIWRSAEKDAPGAALSPDLIGNCIKGWTWRNRDSLSTPVTEIANDSANIEKRSQSHHDDDELPKLARKFRAIERIWGNRLRFNELTNQIELDGSVVEDSGDLRLTLALDHGLPVTLNDCEAIIKRLAKTNRYHPVKEYLESVAVSHGNNTGILNSLASELFGTDIKIYDTFLKKRLVAAVARIFDPGCKVDTALILQGKQAYNKSTFFKVLAGADWFDDSMGAATSERDERLKLHQFWFLEWAELESVFKRKDIAAVKAFLTCCIDTVRAPYERSAVSLKRRSVIVGTTNQDEFLIDSTGNRRFWVCSVTKRIDLKQVAELRDRIWAAAVALYRSGYEWWLSQKEEAIAAEFTEAYRTEDPWIAPIASYLRENSRGEVTTAELLKHALEIEVGRQGKREEIRVADILKELGWSANRRTISGKRRRVWVEPDDRDCPNPSKVVPKAAPPTQQTNQSDSTSGQPGQTSKQAVLKVVQPEVTVSNGFQHYGTNWTTSSPKTNSFSQSGKPQSNGHSPPTEIDSMSDRELAAWEVRS